jgi:hypothetical protein
MVAIGARAKIGPYWPKPKTTRIREHSSEISKLSARLGISTEEIVKPTTYGCSKRLHSSASSLRVDSQRKRQRRTANSGLALVDARFSPLSRHSEVALRLKRNRYAPKLRLSHESEVRLIQTLIKGWWLLALCGVLDAIISIIYFNHAEQGFVLKGAIVFLGKLTLAAGVSSENINRGFLC